MTTNPTTKQILEQIDSLLAQSPNGAKLIVYAPLSYNPYIPAILARWPQLKVITSSQIKGVTMEGPECH